MNPSKSSDAADRRICVPARRLRLKLNASLTMTARSRVTRTRIQGAEHRDAGEEQPAAALLGRMN
ncbi:hypothetical protein, partial [Escherichia coli]|uniref:hypothetical protein n=1 Tax=Escherichia coli TaxID=562 RepID=UPI001BE481C6